MEQVTISGTIVEKKQTPGQKGTTYKIMVDIGEGKPVTLNTKSAVLDETLTIGASHVFTCGVTEFMGTDGSMVKMKWINQVDGRDVTEPRAPKPPTESGMGQVRQMDRMEEKLDLIAVKLAEVLQNVRGASGVTHFSPEADKMADANPHIVEELSNHQHKMTQELSPEEITEALGGTYENAPSS